MGRRCRSRGDTVGCAAYSAISTIAKSSGRPGSCLPGLPQIRTCPIQASGSSSHSFASRRHSAIRDSPVDTGSELGVSAMFPCLGSVTRPSLPRVRSTHVPRLPRCRVGGGALGYPHAGLRPPLKRSVQFSRTPLSQRHANSVGGSKESVRSSVQGPTPRRDGVPATVSSPDSATA